MDKFSIGYFWNGLRSFIDTHEDERDRNLDDWQVFIKQTIDVKAITVKQVPLLKRKNSTYCLCGHRSLKDENLGTKKNSRQRRISSLLPIIIVRVVPTLVKL